MTTRSFSFLTLGSVLTHPGAAGFVVPAAVARLGVAMTGLGLLFSVLGETGSIARAGTATGVFAAAEAAVGPQLARLVDRFGQSRVVPPAVLAHVTAVGVALVVLPVAPTVVVLAVVALAGATVPQPGALSAARWSHLVDDGERLRAAFSFEAAVNDLVFLSGPVLVTVLSTTGAPWTGSVVAATLLGGGCLALARHRRSAPPIVARTGRRGAAPAGPLRDLVFLRTLGVTVALGCFFGAVPLLVTAAARTDGLVAWTGLVLASSSAASIVAGLAYGGLRRAPRAGTVQLVATTVLVLAVGVGTVWPTTAGLTVVLLAGGATIAPLLAASSQIVRATVAPAALTQGFTWVNTASAAGIASSAAATGVLVAAGGVRAGAVWLLVSVGAGLLCAAAGRGR